MVRTVPETEGFHMSFANEEQAQFWSELAPTWLELQDDLEEVSELPGLLAMDRLPLGPGQAVVDLGCGGGRTTLELASRVSPGGKAVGVDIAPELVAGGRERAARLGVDNVEFVHADVQAEDLGEAVFDAAFSRFGVMFFADPVVAFANVRRALRPGGVLSFVCWQNVFENEWMLVPGMAVASVTGSLPPLPAPGEPGPFSLADPDRVQSVLAGADFDRIDVMPHADAVVRAEDRIADVARISTRVGAAREALRDADDDTRRRAVEAVEAALRARVENGQVSASRAVWLVTARA
jgi:SAM-dependent methyltransferase